MASRFDKASRYAARMDGAGFYAWLLGARPNQWQFRRWEDARNVPFPGDPDRTGDTVGRLDDMAQHGIPWIVPVEFQSRPDPDMFGRMLIYASSLWMALHPDEERGSRFALGAAVVKLTGQGTASRRMEWSKGDTTLEFRPVERNLEYESADELLAGVESGRWSRCLLVWVPLMAGADDPILIDRWKRLAATEPDSRRRADFAGLARVFAERAGRKDIWRENLRGWDMEESTVVNEWIAEGEVRGEAKRARTTILRLGQKRFGPVPPGIEAAIRAITDLDRLELFADRVLDATSWDDLLASP